MNENRREQLNLIISEIKKSYEEFECCNITITDTTKDTLYNEGFHPYKRRRKKIKLNFWSYEDD